MPVRKKRGIARSLDTAEYLRERSDYYDAVIAELETTLREVRDYRASLHERFISAAHIEGRRTKRLAGADRAGRGG